MKMSPSGLRRTIPAYGGTTWEDVDASMSSSPSDQDRIAHLERILREEGAFVDPVVLDPTDRSVLDGMHRVVAALRADVAIDVAFSHGPECPVTELRDVRFRFEIVDESAALAWAEGDEPVALSAAVNALSSIHHDDGWIDAPVFSGRDGEMDATWSPRAGSRMPDDHRLTEVLIARAAEAGLRLTVLEISHDPWWLHDED
jgi:hypothetical protein